MRTKTVLIALVAAVLLFGCARQQDVYSLDDRVSALERSNLELERQTHRMEQHNRAMLKAKENISNQVEGLAKSRKSDEMALREKYAGLAAQTQTLQDGAQAISGRLDEIEHQLNQKIKEYEANQDKNRESMDQLATDMAALKKRVDNIDQYLNLERNKGKKAASPKAVTKAGASPASDMALYQKARKAFDGGKFEVARKGFEKLIATYPKSKWADNAQFWIAETYYRDKRYKRAILEYQKVIENYPSGNKVPAAMLKQGFAFSKIGQTNNAKLVLKELIEKYPGSHEAGIAKEKLKSL
jgi:tol-pal system protein YbgF